MRSRRLLLLLFVGILFIIYISTRKCKGVNCLFFEGREGYRIKTVYEDTDKAYRALLEKNNVLLRVEVYSGVTILQAANFNKYRTMQIQGLYEDASSPYPGAISDRITCEEKYKPSFSTIQEKGVEMTTYTGYLNNRLQYGSCVDDQITHTSRSVMFYCSNQSKWYHLEFIVPVGVSKDDRDYLIKSISCVSQPPKTSAGFP